MRASVDRYPWHIFNEGRKRVLFMILCTAVGALMNVSHHRSVSSMQARLCLEYSSWHVGDVTLLFVMASSGAVQMMIAD